MKRDHASLAWMLSVTLLAFAVPALVAGQQAKPELPTDEAKLLEHARARMNHGQWQEADRAFRAYLEKFPQGKSAEEVHAQLGTLHLWYSHRQADARQWFTQACEKFPKSAQYWNYRLQIAQSYQNQQLRQKAIEEYVKIGKEAPDAQVRANAIRQTWNLRDKYLTLNVHQTFTAGQEPAANVNLRNVDKIRYRAVRMAYPDVTRHLDAGNAGDLHQAIAKVGKEGRQVVKEWTAEYSFKKNEWRQERVAVPSTESGVYLLEAEHEDVTMTVVLLVTRFGLVTKSAAGKLVCFAQERATSRPVEGMKIRALHGPSAIEGTTDKDGLFVADGFKGGRVVGLKDGELVTTQSYSNEQPDGNPLVYVVTDRPIYRPNQTVHFRVVHRQEKGQNLDVKPGRRLLVEIHDTKGNKVYEKVHALNAFGSAEGSLVLGDEPPLGEYSVYARPEKLEPNENEWAWRWGAYGQNHGRFRVDEYRKPEYKVDVDFKKSPVLQGEAVEASVNARYYFGSPVADAEVTYTVYRRAHGWFWRCWDYYYDWYADDDDDEDGIGRHGKGMRAWGGPGEQVLQGKGKTDREGKFALRFEASKWDRDAVYTVVAQVTDLSRRVVDGSGSCKATRAEYGLAMSLNKYVYKPGERVNAKVRAATADEKPVADARITLRGYDRRWTKDKYEDLPLFEATSRTDEHGVAEFNCTPELEGGYLYLVAEANDRKDNRVTAEHWAWLCGATWYGDHVNLNGIDLILDKKTYNVGDTAQVLVTSQFKNVTLLFTVEGKEIHTYEVVPVKGHTKLIEFKVDRPAYAPNIFVGVVAIKENQIVQRQRMLIVNPSEKFVTVEIKPDRSQYRPRQKARYEVVTRGADGRPVAAEVALGIVDDSIYALQEEYAADIRKHFIHKRWAQVNTSVSLYYYDWGHAEARADKEEAARAPGAPAPQSAAKAAGGRMALREKDGKPGGYAATEVRSNFADTLAWRTVTTDAEGRAVVEVDIADNLTTWRATARAVTADSRFGQETNSVVTRKNVIVRLQTPRFFTQNDVTIVSAVAHNYLAGEKEVKIEFAAEGLETEGEKERLVRVAPNGETRIDWKARVRAAGRARITVKALTDEDSDAMQLTVPVLAHGAPKWDNRGGVVKERVVERVILPADATKDAAELVVAVSPTHAAMVLDALEYLAGYPYGCVEQTMSRFLPTVVVSQTLQKLGLKKPELEAELPHMVAAGLQRLYNFQHQDGGWGWWQHDASNPWTTAYVVFGLALARDADHAVDQNVLSRGVQALQAHLAKAEDPNQQAYLLYALSAAGVRNEDVRARLSDRLGELNDYSKALVALVLHKDGRDAKPAVEALAKDVKALGGSAFFEGGTSGGWMDHYMEVTAAALRAFLKVDPKSDLVPRMVHWLSQVRQGNYWGSTKQTAMVVFALVEYLAASGDLNPDMTLTLTLNGERVYSERVTRENWHAFQGMRKFAGSALRAGENEIVIEKAGNGSPVYSVFLKTYAQGEDLEASKGGIQIERVYSRVIYERGKRILQKLEGGEEVASGDEVEVTLTVKADRNFEWLMLDDPLPSGFEPIREYWGPYGRRWNYWYSRKEFRDEKVSIAMSTLWRGTHTVTYVMRAETPGDFHALPAVAFNMYQPEIGGNSAEFRIKVRDR